MFGLGFVLSFGYWTTNFAEVQRALSAKNLSAARRTPLIGAYPKIFIPADRLIPGSSRWSRSPGLGGKDPGPAVQQRDPAADRQVPAGRDARARGHRPAGGVHGRRGGQRDRVQHGRHLRPLAVLRPQGRATPRYYLRFGRIATVGGLLISIATAFIAKGYDNIMNYVQLLFWYFNAPLFATFIIAMFWKRTTPWGAVPRADRRHARRGHDARPLLARHVRLRLRAGGDFSGAIVAFVADVVVTVGVSLVTARSPRRSWAGSSGA